MTGTICLPASTHPDMLLWAHRLIRDISSTKQICADSEIRHASTLTGINLNLRTVTSQVSRLVESNQSSDEQIRDIFHQINQIQTQLDRQATQAAQAGQAGENGIQQHMSVLKATVASQQDDLLRLLDHVCAWKAEVEAILTSIVAQMPSLPQINQGVSNQEGTIDVASTHAFETVVHSTSKPERLDNEETQNHFAEDISAAGPRRYGKAKQVRNRKNPVIQNDKTSAKAGPAKARTKAKAKAPTKVIAKPPTKTPTKAGAKASTRPPMKALAKASTKTRAKSPAQPRKESSAKAKQPPCQTRSRAVKGVGAMNVKPGQALTSDEPTQAEVNAMTNSRDSIESDWGQKVAQRQGNADVTMHHDTGDKIEETPLSNQVLACQFHVSPRTKAAAVRKPCKAKPAQSTGRRSIKRINGKFAKA